MDNKKKYKIGDNSYINFILDDFTKIDGDVLVICYDNTLRSGDEYNSYIFNEGGSHLFQELIGARMYRSKEYYSVGELLITFGGYLPYYKCLHSVQFNDNNNIEHYFKCLKDGYDFIKQKFEVNSITFYPFSNKLYGVVFLTQFFLFKSNLFKSQSINWSKICGFNCRSNSCNHTHYY
jgi:hypothetical protein